MSSQVRLLVTDAAWQAIAGVLAEVKQKAGSPPKQTDRMFIEAVLYRARTGIPWRDLPEECGNWDAVYNRFRRWEKRGVWRRLWEELQQAEGAVAKAIFIDSTIVRAPTGGRCPPKKWWPGGPGSGTGSGWSDHENPCRLYR
jgi:transposase